MKVDEIVFDKTGEGFTVVSSEWDKPGIKRTGCLGLMEHTLLQLKSYRQLNKTPEKRQHLEDDISGYEMILATGSEKNAEHFFELKAKSIKMREPFKNNLEVIKALKNAGIWYEPAK